MDGWMDGSRVEGLKREGSSPPAGGESNNAGAVKGPGDKSTHREVERQRSE